MSAMEPKKGFGSNPESFPSRAVSPSSTAFRPSSPFHSARASRPSASDSSLTGDRFDPNVLSEPISCVSRQTFREDCARHRFIVWAAVKRNSCSRMRQDDKLRCPLLRCDRQFPDHEAMLKHLAGCEYLASGEYWCYEHMRIERFDDVKCKHCLGHPSKRRKVLSMAKSFFHSLGHRSKKRQGLEVFSDDPPLAPPPSYDSISLTPHTGVTELPAAHLVEADSTEIRSLPSDMLTDVAAINPQALLEPDSSELDSDCNGRPVTPFTDWGQTRAIPVPDLSWTVPTDRDTHNASSKPSLQLHTNGLQGSRQLVPPTQVFPSRRSTNLSPSSSLRSNVTATSNATTSSSLISPLSNWSGEYSTGSGFNTGLTSPVDDMPVTNSFMTPYEPECRADYSNVSYLNYYYCAELSADEPDARDGVAASSDLLWLSGNAFSVNPPYAGDITLDEDLDLTWGDFNVADQDICCSEVRSIVDSAHDALQAHVNESLLKLQHVPSNRLARQLQSMSTKSVAAAGMRTLRALLSGNRPSSAIETLCFIHLIYAMSVATLEQHTVALSTDLFMNALSCASGLPPLDSTVYRQLVSVIWQPTPLDPDSSRHMAGSMEYPGKIPETPLTAAWSPDPGASRLLGVALNFLDRLEISLLLGQAPSSREELASDLYNRHLHDIRARRDITTPAFQFTANRVLIPKLEEEFGNAAGLEDRLASVAHQVDGGTIGSIRRLELELAKAGMNSMDTLRYYGTYMPAVRRQCDKLYEHHNSLSSPRLVYHTDAVSLVENLMSLCDAQTRRAGSSNDIRIPDGFPPQRAFASQQLHQQPVFGPDTPFAMALDNPLHQPDSFRFDGYNLHIPTATTTLPSNVDNGQASIVSLSTSHAVTAPSSTAFEPHAGSEPVGNAGQQQQQPDPHPQNATEADSCDLCDYVPKGDPQWFKTSLAKHKRTMHTPAQVYKCPFPGCSSQYRNRADNLRQHQLQQGHFVDGDGSREHAGGRRREKRPAKRKKLGEAGGHGAAM